MLWGPGALTKWLLLGTFTLKVKVNIGVEGCWVWGKFEVRHTLLLNLCFWFPELSHFLLTYSLSSFSIGAQSLLVHGGYEECTGCFLILFPHLWTPLTKTRQNKDFPLSFFSQKKKKVSMHISSCTQIKLKHSPYTPLLHCLTLLLHKEGSLLKYQNCQVLVLSTTIIRWSPPPSPICTLCIVHDCERWGILLPWLGDVIWHSWP